MTDDSVACFLFAVWTQEESCLREDSGVLVVPFQTGFTSFMHYCIQNKDGWQMKKRKPVDENQTTAGVPKKSSTEKKDDLQTIVD